MIKLLSAEYTENGLIAVEFSDGNKGVFDFSAYLSERTGSLLVPLADENYARRCFIDAGALCWPNGWSCRLSDYMNWFHFQRPLSGLFHAYS